MTVLYRDELFRDHDTGPHPESARRLVAIDRCLDESGLAARCRPGAFEPLTEEQIARTHAPAVIERVRGLAEAGGGRLDPDTVVSPASFRVALHAAGAAVAAVDAVLTGDDPTALCLVRPPGHHATPERSMGFCLFNNVAIAARHARTAHGLTRVLIVDWDVHHGNGTQDVFYADPSVMFVSVHRFGGGFYPGTGDIDETGTGPGLGFTRNVPLRWGTRRAEYRDRFTRALEASAAAVRPELVLLSAGFDAHHLDPIGSLGLEVEDFAVLTRQVVQVARTHAGGRLVSCLEGGYHVGALAECVRAHLDGLLENSGGPPAGGEPPRGA